MIRKRLLERKKMKEEQVQRDTFIYILSHLNGGMFFNTRPTPISSDKYSLWSSLSLSNIKVLCSFEMFALNYDKERLITLTFEKNINSFFYNVSNNLLYHHNKGQALHTPVLIFHLCPSIPMCSLPPPPACCFTIKPGSTTRPTTYETSDTGQQVNLLAPYLSDPTIYPAILYIFHLWCIFSIITKPSIHPPFHPSTIACPPSFSLACCNGPLLVDRGIYVGLYLWRREKNKGEKAIGKNTGGKGGGQLVTRKCGRGWCVCLCLCGVSHHSSGPL